MDKILVTRSSMPPMEEYMEEIKGPPMATMPWSWRCRG